MGRGYRFLTLVLDLDSGAILFVGEGKKAESLRPFWRRLKAAASEAIMAHGGTISHQHGVGSDHLPYLPAEKGATGVAAIQAICAHFDPASIMNPGKLVE